MSDTPTKLQTEIDPTLRRWHIARHEAGHALANIVFGGRPGFIEVRDEIGVTPLDHRLSPWLIAVATAAGPAAERLAIPMPSVTPLPLPELPPPPDDDDAPVPELVSLPADRSIPESDEIEIAKFCITNARMNPARYYLLQRTARKILDDHRAALVAIAAAAFEKSIVTPLEVALIGTVHGIEVSQK